MKRLQWVAWGLALCAGAGLLSGCTVFRQRAANKTLQEYLDAEIQHDVAQQRTHFDEESLSLVQMAATGYAAQPLQGWGLASYETSPEKITIKDKKGYAAVTGKFNGPNNQTKTITYTVFMSGHEELTKDGKQEVWVINEVETKRLLIDELLGKGYGDLWVNTIKATRASRGPY